MKTRYRIPDGTGGWLLDLPEGQPFTLHKTKYSGRFLARASDKWLQKHHVQVVQIGVASPTDRQLAADVRLSREIFLNLIDDLAGLGEEDPSAIDWLRQAIPASYLTPLRKRRALNLIEAGGVRRKPRVDATLWDDLLFQAARAEPEQIDEAFLRHAETPGEN